MSVKKIFGFLSLFSIFLLFLGCSTYTSSSNNKETSSCLLVNGKISKSQSDNTKPMETGYAYGLPFANYYDSDVADKLKSEYDKWKAKYITADGTKGHGLRVRRDKTSDYDTVSEGMGYGLLLSLYFNDKPTFDGLLDYIKNHKCADLNLMHWKVDKDGNNVSEFAAKGDLNGYNIVVPYITGYRSAVPDPCFADSAIIPHGPVYKETTNKNSNIYILKTASQITKAVYDAKIAEWDKKPGFYKFSKYDRSYSSATDADVDICAALVLAVYKWGDTKTNTYDYVKEAKDFIYDFYYTDIKNSFVKAGSLWPEKPLEGWNPSYVTPAWYELFEKFRQTYDSTRSYDWKKLKDNTLSEMKKIIDRGNVLFPDWVNTSNNSYGLAMTSDRLYLFDDDPNRAEIKGAMSFNSYYDAVRVPWRLAVSYSWYGPQSVDGTSTLYYIMSTMKKFVQSINNSTGKGIKGILDGYMPNGSLWQRACRDGFNNMQNDPSKKEGQNHSTEFVSMYSTLSLFDTGNVDYTFLEDCYNETVNVVPKSDYTYYGDALRLLTLLYLTGKFVNYSDSKSYSSPLYYSYSPGTGDTFYTTDYNESRTLVDKNGGKCVPAWIEGYVFNSQVYGTVPLYRFYSTLNGDHYYSTNPSIPANYIIEDTKRITGYVYPKTGSILPSFRIPMVQFHTLINGDNAFTNNLEKIYDGVNYGAYGFLKPSIYEDPRGYKNYGTQFYILPPY